MKINIEAIKKSLKLIGIDIDDSLKMAMPAMNNWLNSKIENISTKENESKGFILISDSKGEYHLITAIFDEHANKHIQTISHEKIDNLFNSILNTIKQ